MNRKMDHRLYMWSDFSKRLQLDIFMIGFSSLSCLHEGKQHPRSSTKRICRQQSEKAGDEKTDEMDSVLSSSLTAVCLRLADLIQ